MKGKITKRTVDSLKPVEREVLLWDDELRGFGLKVTPEGRKVYLIQYRMGGRGFPTRRYTIGAHGKYTPEEARNKAGNLLQGVRDGIDPMAEKASAKINSVEGLVTEFVKSRQRKGGRSIDETERLLKREVVQAWGMRPVASITRGDIGRLVDAIKDRGAGTMANRTLAHLKTMFSWAEARGTIKASPAKGVEQPSAEVHRERHLSDDELIETWNAAQSLGWPFGPAVKLIILTGQRREEVGQMAWPELFLDKGLWTLPGSRSKNGQPHDIHLSANAVELIEILPKMEGADLVFTTTGETPISGWSKAKRNLDRKIHEARIEKAKETGVDPEKVKPMPHWRIHDLRRTFATGLNNLGVLPHVADRILNHVSKRKGGVMAVYNRAEYASERRAAMTLWAEHVDQLLSSKRSEKPPQKRARRGVSRV